MDSTNHSLDEVFDITPVEEPAKLAKKAKKVIVQADRGEDKEKDYVYARSQLYNIVEKMQESIDGAMEVALQSEHPRAFEVAINGMKSAAEVAEKLTDLHSKNKELMKEDVVREQAQQNVQNNMFVGSTADLMMMLKEQQKSS